MLTRSLGVFLLFGVAVAVTGCTAAVTGRPSPNAAAVVQIQEERTPLTSDRALGDLSTIDYCSLFDAAAVEKGGADNVGELQQSFGECTVSAKLSGQAITVEVGFLDKNATGRIPDPTKRLPRGLVAQRDLNAGPDVCTTNLAFPDRVSVEIYTYVDDVSNTVSGSQALCQVNSAVLDRMVTAVTQKKVAHLTFAPGTLGTVDACALISDSRVTQEIGMPMRHDENPAKHRCQWKVTSSGPRATLWFYAENPSPAVPGTTTETIAGRQSIVQKLSGNYCLVTTVVGPYAAKSGENETAGVYVNMLSAVPKDACGVARALANVAWPQLPSS